MVCIDKEMSIGKGKAINSDGVMIWENICL